MQDQKLNKSWILRYTVLFICRHTNTDTCQVTDTTVYIVNLYTFASFLLPGQRKYCCPKNSTVFILLCDGHMSYRYLSALWGKRRINSGWGGPISLYMAIVGGGISSYMPVLGGPHLSLHAITCNIRDWLTQGSNTRSKASHGVPCFLELTSLCALVGMVR